MGAKWLDAATSMLHASFSHDRFSHGRFVLSCDDMSDRQLASHVHKSHVRTDMSISSMLPNSLDLDRIEGLLV